MTKILIKNNLPFSRIIGDDAAVLVGNLKHLRVVFTADQLMNFGE